MLCSVGLQATWMNIILKNMWPQYNQAIGKMVLETVKPQLEDLPKQVCHLIPILIPGVAGLPFDSHTSRLFLLRSDSGPPFDSHTSCLFVSHSGSWCSRFAF